MKELNLFGNYFGGCLDNANGELLRPEQEVQLRFLALFANQIVVPDTFFHCYGPIFKRAQLYLNNHIGAQEDIILGLIAAGIIVPAIRNSTKISLDENYRSAPGVCPGEYQYPTEEESKKTLPFLDEILNKNFYKEEWSSDKSLRTIEALRHQFFSTDFDTLAQTIGNEIGIINSPKEDWVPALRKFVNAIGEQLNKDHFRRGYLENALADSLSFSKHKIYNELSNLEDRLPLDKIVKYLYSEMGVYYQIGQADALNTVPSISYKFTGHKINNTALTKALNLKEFPTNRSWIPFQQPISQRILMSLKVSDILQLRSDHLQQFKLSVLSSLSEYRTTWDKKRQYDIAISEFCERIARKPTKNSLDTFFVHLLAQGASMVVGQAFQMDLLLNFSINVALTQIPDAAHYIQKKGDSSKLAIDFNNFFIPKE